MGIKQPTDLRERVIQAAEAVLERDGSIGPLELLQQMRFLEPAHLQGWRKGNPYYTTIEPHIQCGAEKLRKTYGYLQEWVEARGLKPVEASYVRAGTHGSEPLQVTQGGDPDREGFFRTHFAPAELSEPKAERLKQKLSKAPDLVVFQLVSREAKCSECQTELFKGNLLFMEKGAPLCLACADLDYLEFLPAGDAALSRRAKKYSPLSAVVVRFSRTRKRYERQGILVTPEAIAQAEDECAADAAERTVRRATDAERRRAQDRELIEAMTAAIRTQYPQCPAAEARHIAEHTAQRGSGRVGRSAAGRSLDLRAIDLAVVSWVRHQHTNYDTLLMQGIDRSTARQMVGEQIDRVIGKWSGFVTPDRR